MVKFVIALFLIVISLGLAYTSYRVGKALKALIASGNRNIGANTIADHKASTYISLVASIISGIIAVILLATSMLTSVGTKEVGVVTTFGKPTGYLSNGLHFKAPWAKVTNLDAAIQTDTYVKAKEANTGDCITVRIAHQATACADTSIRWQIKETAAPALFQQYRTFDTIRASLVTRELHAAMNDATNVLDPLAVDAQGNAATIGLGDIQAKVLAQMQSEIGDQVDVKSVIVSVVHFDDQTQQRINSLQSQIADTRIAQQQIQTNKAQAEANRVLATSISNDPNILVSKCLDILAKAANLPSGFSCFPGSTAGVLVSAK